MRLSLLKPLNIEQEKEKFFNDPGSYNPQFTYSEEIDSSYLTEYGTPSSPLIEKAAGILEKAYDGKTEEELYSTHGNILNYEKAEYIIKKYLELNNLGDRFNIEWSDNTVSRTTITTDTIRLKYPPTYREYGIYGMLHHEVGTHAMRRINYEHQDWYGKKEDYGFSPYLKTEEGLAVIHSLLDLPNKIAFKPALRYLAVNIAQNGSFCDVWDFLQPYVENSRRRWSICLRTKRGLKDTSHPGGLTKDLVYFDGFIQVLNWLRDHNFDLSKLYIGKIAIDDVNLAASLSPDYKPILPYFYNDTYPDRVKIISKINNI